MKEKLIDLLKLFVLGFIVPLITAFLAEFGVRIACLLYWGEKYLLGHLGFKLGMKVLGLNFSLTLTYYLFCFVYHITDRQKLRKWILYLFLTIPPMLYLVSSRLDFIMSFCFTLFHLTYYFLFILTRKLFLKVETRKKLF